MVLGKRSRDIVKHADIALISRSAGKKDNPIWANLGVLSNYFELFDGMVATAQAKEADELTPIRIDASQDAISYLVRWSHGSTPRPDLDFKETVAIYKLAQCWIGDAAIAHSRGLLLPYADDFGKAYKLWKFGCTYNDEALRSRTGHTATTLQFVTRPFDFEDQWGRKCAAQALQQWCRTGFLDVLAFPDCADQDICFICKQREEASLCAVRNVSNLGCSVLTEYGHIGELADDLRASSECSGRLRSNVEVVTRRLSLPRIRRP